ncbi:hypothetical protein QG085_04805 [Kingella kingae]|uniref:hypothetical protein n=1 Tax=Kingella kingae TaxID=504 RepID=UPI00254EF59F|nr:hypothetical protein [Kingella kingae]MDK4566836.1 hypothetical protein [Kingella kingae]MDK4628517.1 hypothetical protein [Kingella kingae]MDK4636417.1 hypothetical protein [Kingella kingae]MDK4638421.1 hypothetical protein [Kingella kingae]MDK4672041.1 hypothetical protein [Kingella kingae]
MSNEVEVIDVNAVSNHAAMHSVMVMEQWGNGETYNEATWVERGRHAVRQLRIALRENREQLAAKDKVLGDKNAKIDELAEKLEKAKKKGSLKEPDPADVGNELHIAVGAKEVAIRSHIVQLGEYFTQLAAHEQAHGISHQAKMTGVINQIIMDCQHLRDQYGLPETIPEDDMPEWLTGSDLQPESE